MRPGSCRTGTGCELRPGLAGYAVQGGWSTCSGPRVDLGRAHLQAGPETCAAAGRLPLGAVHRLPGRGLQPYGRAPRGPWSEPGVRQLARRRAGPGELRPAARNRPHSAARPARTTTGWTRPVDRRPGQKGRSLGLPALPAGLGRPEGHLGVPGPPGRLGPGGDARPRAASHRGPPEPRSGRGKGSLRHCQAPWGATRPTTNKTQYATPPPAGSPRRKKLPISSSF